jgi:hypothetical protein
MVVAGFADVSSTCDVGMVVVLDDAWVVTVGLTSALELLLPTEQPPRTPMTSARIATITKLRNENRLALIG